MNNKFSKLFLVTSLAAVLVSCSEKVDENLPKFEVNTIEARQTFDGIGSSLTESSAYVMACLDPEVRAEVIEKFFGEKGANFSVTRTHIGASDFSVEGLYSLDMVEGDEKLEHFSMEEDMKGFSPSVYPDIIDSTYDLYHLMMEVNKVKKSQRDTTFRVVATTWTAPAWMKDNNKYYDKENRTGGRLLEKYYQAFADYYVKYIQFYKEQGINIWAVSPENEPMGNDGSWESMQVSPAEEAAIIGKYMGPTFERNGLDVKIFGFDQNTFEMVPYVDAIYGDSAANSHTYGMALHWYGSTFTPFGEVMDSIHYAHPDKVLMHTEGCIDNLGCDPWSGVSDPDGFKEENWFGNDEFWWSEVCTDWAYSTPFWPELHPKYIAPHRYARYIIEGMNHWMTGFIDWNFALDSIGGMNHVGNMCGAPLMVNTATKKLHFTPMFEALAALSRNLRPGDQVLYVEPAAELGDKVFVSSVRKADGRIVLAMLNTTSEEQKFNVKVDEALCPVTLPSKAIAVYEKSAGKCNRLKELEMVKP